MIKAKYPSNENSDKNVNSIVLLLNSMILGELSLGYLRLYGRMVKCSKKIVSSQDNHIFTQIYLDLRTIKSDLIGFEYILFFQKMKLATHLM